MIRIQHFLIATFFCLQYDIRDLFIRTEFLLKFIDDPHAHDVLLIAVVADTALVGIVGFHGTLIRDRLLCLDTQQ